MTKNQKIHPSADPLMAFGCSLILTAREANSSQMPTYIIANPNKKSSTWGLLICINILKAVIRKY